MTNLLNEIKEALTKSTEVKMELDQATDYAYITIAGTSIETTFAAYEEVEFQIDQAITEAKKAVEVVKEEAPKGITLVARLKCQVTGKVRIETSNEYANKNQFRKVLKSWADTTIQAISDNRDLEAMEAGYKNFLDLKKQAERWNFQYKEGREYNRILNEVAL